MDRRDFLKFASCAGLSVVTPSAFAGRGVTAGGRSSAAYGGTFFLIFNATGGWDPTHVCDPKPKADENTPNPMTNILAADVATSGAISYPGRFDEMIYNGAGAGITGFFEKHASRLTVINGIDMQTNGHDSGQRYTFSGTLTEGFPSLGAYMAGTFDPTLPMAYLAFGGFSDTAGVAPRTRAGNLGALERLAYPTRFNPDDETATFHSARALEIIDEAQWNRDQALINGQKLPKLRQAANTLFGARAGSNELKQLQAFLPDPLADTELARQAQVSIAAYKAGIAVSAQLSMGGFDTHGNHDQSQIPRLEQLLAGVDFAMEEAERQGVADRVVIIVGSDFGRTPGYNDGNGKDHWPVTSMMFMGAGIPGNRVIGKTNPEHRAFGINPDLSVVEDLEAPLKILPAHVHAALRDKYANGADNPLASLFPLSIEQKLPLLG